MRANGAPCVDTVAGRDTVCVARNVADHAAVAVRKYPRSIYLESVITVSNRIGEQPAIRLQHNAVGAVLIGCHAADLDVTDRPDARAEDPVAIHIAGYEALCSYPR